MVQGKIVTECVQLLTDDEIEIDYFVTTREQLELSGFVSVEDFIEYIEKSSHDTIVAEDISSGDDITAYMFNRRDGYNLQLKIGGSSYWRC